MRSTGAMRRGGLWVGTLVIGLVLACPRGSAAQQTTLDWIAAEFDSLPGVDLNADAQTMLDFLNGLPEVVSAGKMDNPRSVWAVLTNGDRLGIVFNQAPPPPPSPAVAPPPPSSPPVSPEGLPQSSKARLLHAFGPLWGSDATPDIRSWLTDHGYTAPIDADATVDSLKTVGGDGVLFIDSHGGMTGGGWAVWTSTEVNDDNDQKYALDRWTDGIKQPRLSKMLARNNPWPLPSTWHYAITAAFVLKYWGNFANHAFVYIDTCSSDTPASADFKAAVQSKHALGARPPVYAGWTGTNAANDGEDTARLVFDRLLGANQAFLESGFKQRPFDYPSVLRDLPQHGLGTSLGAVLQFTPPVPGDGDFQLLAPSIEHVFVYEPPAEFSPDPHLHVLGIFGSDPRDEGATVSVTVDGTPRNIFSWSNSEIVTDIPAFGPGASGDVIVTVRQQKSNVARLTEWQVMFNLTLTGQGSLKQTATYTVDFRADLRKSRGIVHDPPNEPAFGGFVTQGSLETFANTGVATYSHTEGDVFTEMTYTWSHSGGFVPQRFVPETRDNVFVGAAAAFDSHAILLLVTENGAYHARIVNIHTHTCAPVSGCHDSDTDPPVNDALFGWSQAFGTITVSLDDGANIRAGALDVDVANVDTQPPPKTAHVHIEWYQSMLAAPPDPDSAR